MKLAEPSKLTSIRCLNFLITRIEFLILQKLIYYLFDGPGHIYLHFAMNFLLTLLANR